MLAMVIPRAMVARSGSRPNCWARPKERQKKATVVMTRVSRFSMNLMSQTKASPAQNPMPSDQRRDRRGSTMDASEGFEPRTSPLTAATLRAKTKSPRASSRATTASTQEVKVPQALYSWMVATVAAGAVENERAPKRMASARRSTVEKDE
jgi:hypothetical protein